MITDKTCRIPDKMGNELPKGTLISTKSETRDSVKRLEKGFQYRKEALEIYERNRKLVEEGRRIYEWIKKNRPDIK